MTKLLKFLKPYAGAVAAIICVLIVQAYCDLSLPAYTSDIVNVGIQQSGIDEKVPEQISEEDLGKLLMLVPSDQQEEVQNAYEESKADHSIDGKVFWRHALRLTVSWQCSFMQICSSRCSLSRERRC